MTEAHTAPVNPAPSPPYFPVSLVKLSVLSVFSLGIYDIYWFYQHWKRERDATGTKLSPLLRAVFGVIFAYSLFRRIRDAGAHAHVLPSVSAGAMAFAYFIWVGTWRLPDPYWLLSVFSFVPLLPVQRAANAINTQIAPEADRNTQFSGANVALIVCGVLMLSLIVLGLFLSADIGGDSPSMIQVSAAG
jgi:hypothetical protein